MSTNTQQAATIDVEEGDWEETAPSGVQSVAITNEPQQSPKKPSKRTKRDWTGFDILRVYLRPKVHDELNARVALTHLSQSDIIEASLAAYLKAEPKVDEQLGKLLKMVLPHDLFTSVDALRSAARTSWIETIRGALVRATQPAAPEPPKREPPRREPTINSVPAPRVTAGYLPGVSVTDTTR